MVVTRSGYHLTMRGFLSTYSLPTKVSIRRVSSQHHHGRWWRTLHQKASLSVGRRPEITGEMYWTLLYSTLAVTIVASWLIVHRYRVIRLEELRDEEALNALIASRLREDE